MRKSPLMMTPPRRAGVGGELARAVMSLPLASTDSGLVASMGDTLEQTKVGCVCMGGMGCDLCACVCVCVCVCVQE